MAFYDLLYATYFGSTLEQYLLFFGSLIAGIILAKILYYFIKKYVGALTAKTANKFDDLIIEAIETPLLFAGFIAGLVVGYHFLSPDIEFIKNNFGNAVRSLIILNLAWLLIRLTDGFLDHIVLPITRKTKPGIDDHILPLIRKLFKFTIVAFSLVVILSSFGIDVFPLLAGLGIGGLALAFAAQKTIEDLFGGLSILASKPFVLGNTVKVKGIEGDVTYVGLRHTRIRDTDGRLVTLPNAQIAQDTIVNISSEPTRKVQQTLLLGYQTNSKKTEEVLEILRDIAQKHPDIAKKEIRALVRNYTGSGIEILFIYHITNKPRILDVIGEVNMEIKKRFEAGKIEFASPPQPFVLGAEKGGEIGNGRGGKSDSGAGRKNAEKDTRKLGAAATRLR